MIGSDRMAVVDENAAALGVPRKQLMESSGHAVARVVREHADAGDRVVVVAGRGNNGGDAFVAARFLDEYHVTTVLLGRADAIGTTIARENWDALQRAEYDTKTVADSTTFSLPECDVVVDAMLGTGVTGALREPEATAAEAVNDADATVVSVDVPSGVDADTGDAEGVAVEADHVVTFHDQKPGLEAVAAEVTVADIGIPEAAETFVERGDLRALSRPEDAHKGEFGRVLVVGGGPYAGAPALSGQAAMRAGADLSFVATPGRVADTVQGYEEGLIVRELAGDLVLPRHVDQLLDEALDADCVVIGPGLGASEGTLDAVREFLELYDGRAVVDADALQVVPDVDTDADLLCTPHQGEFAGMGGERADDWRERAENVEALAAELGQTLLVKGAHDVISDGERTRVNRTGNPGMTVGGTGDVLAGICGALFSTHDAATAGAIGAYVNGRAGDAVVDEQGYGLLASDLLSAVPPAMWGDDDA
ncbi:NAD(P)H-hydrate dehydratase [Halorubellus sp. JP-L1]|uniref:NAD(P)H-hydrate dehydratase n=1 Tax=Halorubellus sp. JP-L1 TaxID=2715753 RepID=UPI00140BFA08|nr:NAD(P)H-hydrate dehydratase [Halorubellus sp. JP-L1]NHN40841.1 NAD(P)H-hydrate dehydratase [Halorubellus sp. JP-L1]